MVSWARDWEVCHASSNHHKLLCFKYSGAAFFRAQEDVKNHEYYPTKRIPERLKGSHFISTLQLLAGGDNHLLSGLDLERDTSRYYYLTMGGEASTTTSSDKKLYAEVRRAMGVSKYKMLLMHIQVQGCGGK